jgi:membrane fusion protein (multidrug efflux system)
MTVNGSRIMGMGVALSVLLAGCTRTGPAGGAGAPVMQVVVIEAVQRPVAETLSLVGTLLANEIVEVKSETDGVIEEISFEEGQAVEAGALLVRLDQSKLASVVAEAEANFQLSQANHDRAKQLFRDQLISQQEFDQAAAMFSFNQATLQLRRRQLEDTQVHAPFGGVVGSRSVSPGQVISKDTTLTWLVDLDPLKVEVNVPERFLGRLKLGQTIEFPIAAYGDRSFTGEVYYISPYVEETTRTAVVRARLPNPKYELKPGMLATLEITLQVRDQAVVISEAGLAQVQDQNRAVVFVVNEALTVEARDVVLGVRMPGEVEVRTGLQAGETVIVEGIQKVGPGSKVALAPAESAAPYRVRPGPEAAGERPGEGK